MAAEKIVTPRSPGTFVEKFPLIANLIAENLQALDGGMIGIDIDAVTQATYTLALRNVSRRLGLQSVIPKERLTSYWELVKIAQHYGIAEDEALEYARSSWNDHEVYQNSPAMPGIRSLLEIFRYVQIPHIFISSRPPEFLETTQIWFGMTFPWINLESIILGRAEGMSGGEFKTGAVKKYGVVLHLEDAPEEAIPIVEQTSARVILVPQPWNLQEEISHPQIKTLTRHYSEVAGVWPVLRFLASPEARDFLRNVAQ
jgi:hypothetical protein